MKKLLLIFFGMLVSLVAMALFSFKNEESPKAEVVILVQYANDISIYKGVEGFEVSAKKLLNLKIDKSGINGYMINAATAKTLEYFYAQGFKIAGESTDYVSTSTQLKSYTLVKQN